MKKFFIVLSILLAAVIIGAIVFISTMDINQLLPTLRDQLQKNLGLSIQYQEANVSWTKGLAIEIQKLAIEEAEEHPKEDVLRVEELRAHLDLFALLRGHIQIGSVDLVKPEIRIVKTRSGKILILGLGNPTSENKQKTEQALPFGFLIEDLKAVDSEIYYRDESVSPVKIINAHRLKLKVENFSINKPFDITASGELFGNAKTFEASTRLNIALSGSPVSLSETSLKIDLNTLDLNQLKLALPALQTSSLDSVGGQIDFDFQKILLGSEGIQDLDGKIKLSNGSVKLSSSQSQIQNIQAVLDFFPDTIQIIQADLSFGSGQGQLRGAIKNWQHQPSVSVEAQINRLPLGELMRTNPSEPHLEGSLSLGFRGNIAPQEGNAAPFVDGSGTIRIDQGVLVNMNILHEVFQKLSIIPGLMDRLSQNLPEESRQKLSETDTRFATIEQPFTFRQGLLILDPVHLRTESIELQGAGQYLLGRDITAKAMVYISPDFSMALVRSVNELSTLSGEDGRIAIPVQISGIPPDVKIFPDLNYIGSRVAAAKTQQVISNILQKRKPFENAAAAAQPQQVDEFGNPIPQTTHTQNQNTSTSPLGGLLQNVLGGGSQQTVSSSDGMTSAPVSTKRPKGNQIFGELLSAALSNSQGESSTQ